MKQFLTKDNLENMIDAGCIDEADKDEILRNQEKADNWDKIQGYTAVPKEDLESYKEDAEKYRFWMKGYREETIKKELEIVERLKKHFNADNALTKQEYKQKILGEENA